MLRISVYSLSSDFHKVVFYGCFVECLCYLALHFCDEDRFQFDPDEGSFEVLLSECDFDV